MARFLSLLALSTLAVFASSAVATPDSHHVARAFGNHHNVAKRHGEVAQQVARKRDSSKRCKPKTSGAPTPIATHSAATSASVKKATATSAAAPTTHAAQQGAQTTPAPASTDKATSTQKAAPTSSAVAVSKPPPASTGNANGKIGLCWSNHEADLIPQFKNNNVGWIYNWKPIRDYGMNTQGLNYIPMLWGWKSVDDFQKNVVAGYASYAAGMNEPDLSSQSNISPSDGATMWGKYLAPLKSQGYKLISPAPATGPKWLQQMKAACSQQGIDCSWDYTAAHIYTTSLDSFKTVAASYHSGDFGWAPVMITEYACQDYSGNNQQASSDEIWAFMTGTKSWLNDQDWIAAYFYFAPMTSSELESNALNGANAMINSNGKTLTDLGRFYIS
jgi:hypothetical protein